jgi:hypothetical protein
MNTNANALIAIALISLSAHDFIHADEIGEQAESITRFHGQRQLLTNPLVEAMLDSVSPERIMVNMDTLVGFYNRNTASDTISNLTGIGAARRWIYSRFLDYSDDPEAVEMTPSFFSFTATVCGSTRQHRNVMATITGARAPERHFVVSGHMDSRNTSSCNTTSYAPGANDDGSGTIVSLEMARVLSRYSFESTVILMTVTGEEQGLYGSTAYAQWAEQNGQRIDGMITNDVVGNIEGCVDPSCPPGDPVIIDSLSVRHFSGQPATGISRQLARYMKLKGQEYLPDFTVNLIAALDRPGRGGDHIPFYDRGYAAVRFTESHENGDGSGFNGRQHNQYDTISNYNTNAGYIATIARLNIAGIASLALAPDPPSGLTAVNAGDGQSALLSWPDMNNEFDFAGYRVAVRRGSQLYYSDIHDAGDTNSYLLTGLVEGQLVYLSLSAYDADDNESVFSDEISFTPFGLPTAPTGVDATSLTGGISLSWRPNPEIDIEAYKIYRQANGQNQPELVRTSPHPDSAWVDTAVTEHLLYRYYLTAVDTESQESQRSDYIYGQLVTHDLGILLIDATLDGSGVPYRPTDATVDSFYHSLLYGFRPTDWDEADSASAGAVLTDAHMAPYSTVFIHCDRTDNLELRDDTTHIKKYLDQGGNLFICGWELSGSIAGNSGDSAQFPEGSFFHDYLKIDSLQISPSVDRDFVRGVSLMTDFYPDLIIDSLKAPLFSHRLYGMEAFMRPLAGMPITEEVYAYESSLGENSRLHGEPVGLRYLGADFGVFVLDVPLFYISSLEAGLVATRAMLDFGEYLVSVDDPGTAIPEQTGASNYPNPFNSSTIISFNLTGETEVEVSIFDLLGRRIEHIQLGILPQSRAELRWDAAERPSGPYFYTIRAGEYRRSGRMLLLK